MRYKDENHTGWFCERNMGAFVSLFQVSEHSEHHMTPIPETLYALCPGTGRARHQPAGGFSPCNLLLSAYQLHQKC